MSEALCPLGSSEALGPSGREPRTDVISLYLEAASELGCCRRDSLLTSKGEP